MAEKACDGGRVFEAGDMAECAECGTQVRWGLQDDPFWGFQNCQRRRRDYEIGYTDARLDAQAVPHPKPEDASADFAQRGYVPRPLFQPTPQKERL